MKTIQLRRNAAPVTPRTISIWSSNTGTSIDQFMYR